MKAPDVRTIAAVVLPPASIAITSDKASKVDPGNRILKWEIKCLQEMGNQPKSQKFETNLWNFPLSAHPPATTVVMQGFSIFDALWLILEVSIHVFMFKYSSAHHTALPT